MSMLRMSGVNLRSIRFWNSRVLLSLDMHAHTCTCALESSIRCIHAYVGILYIHVSTHVRVHTDTCAYTQTRIQTNVHTKIQRNLCRRADMHMHSNRCAHVQTCRCIQTLVHTCTHAHMQTLVPHADTCADMQTCTCIQTLVYIDPFIYLQRMQHKDSKHSHKTTFKINTTAFVQRGGWGVKQDEVRMSIECIPPRQ